MKNTYKMALFFALTLSVMTGSIFSNAQPKAATEVLWTRSAECAEYTKAGRHLRWLNRNICRVEVGSFARRTQNGQCAEYTKTQIFIRWLDRSNCR